MKERKREKKRNEKKNVTKRGKERGIIEREKVKREVAYKGDIQVESWG